MKILFLSSQYPPNTLGGIGSYVQVSAASLAALGHQVHVITRADELSDVVEENVVVHKRPLVPGRGLGLMNMPNAAGRIRLARSALRDVKHLGIAFDVIEAPDWGAEGLLLGLAGEVPVVTHLHTGMLLNTLQGDGSVGMDVRLVDLMERRAARSARAITAPSNLIIDELKRMGWLRGCPEPQVIRYPIDLDVWSDLPPVDQTDPIILFAGRLEHRKAPEVIIEAVAKSGVTDAQVSLVGRSSRDRSGRDYEARLTEMAARLKVRLHIQAHIDRSEMRFLYGQARVVVIASRFDNFPMSALEGMAANRPTIVTDRTGTHEILQGELQSLVVPSDDPECMAEVLRPLLLDERAARQYGALCGQRVADLCDPLAIATKRADLYQLLAR